MSGVLIISPEPWEAQPVSKHHYAMELARAGHDVLFFGPPQQGRVMSLEPVTFPGGGLRVVHDSRVAPGLRYMPARLRRWLERHWLERLEATAQVRIDVVWLFENSRFFDMRFAGRRVKIYQQVDLNQDFHPLVAAATADLTIAVSGPIERRLTGAARHLLRLGHGVAEAAEEPVPASLLDQRFPMNRRHAVLTGNLDIGYLDVDLLASLVEQNPGVLFHFVGQFTPGGRLHGRIGKALNVVWWGRQPFAALPSILRRADLLMVTYLADRFRDQLANPHKMMEYLASGAPILATYTEEYADKPELVVIADDTGDFLQKFGALIAAPATHAGAEARARRQAFAAAHSYGRQIARVAAALGEVLPGDNPLAAGAT